MFSLAPLYIGARLCLFVLLQAAGLVGAEAELCPFCHGEGCPQGHVHQERGGQCAQQQRVGVSVIRNLCRNVPSSAR